MTADTLNPLATAGGEAAHNAAPRVSVIVRSMDRSSLAQTLDSIATQTYSAIEVVIVNAKGRQHSPLPQHCGAFPVVVASGDDGAGLQRSSAANHGLLAASGSLALFLDDDDVLLPDHLSRLVEALALDSAAPAAYAGVEMGRDDEAGNWCALHRFDSPFDPIRLLFENYLPIHAVLFRRDAAVAGLRLDETFPLFEDWDWWLQLASLGPFVHVPGVSARYRVTEREQSNVFAHSPETRAARARLFEKWRHRISASQYGELLERAQSLYRDNAQQTALLTLLQGSEADLRALIVARERELAEGERMRKGLQVLQRDREREIDSFRQLMAAREQEALTAQAYAASLAAVLADREREIIQRDRETSELRALLSTRDDDHASASAYAVSLSSALQAREREVAAAAAHASSLTDVLAARDGEIAAFSMELAARDAVCSARDVEIAAQAAEITARGAEIAAQAEEIAARGAAAEALRDTLATLHAALAEKNTELQRLLDESPKQALLRILRKKKHALQRG